MDDEALSEVTDCLTLGPTPAQSFTEPIVKGCSTVFGARTATNHVGRTKQSISVDVFWGFAHNSATLQPGVFNEQICDS